ncbi:MAG TPA: SDR family oxidoreductase [Polyangiaceae bacterium]|jgi:NAD(P)-dependent dehydrogenase (short-subunit alcohol dehydrogenase family)|nr:SDR family oxidoreductase [Polyangiaceae bacterium]
MSAPARAKLAAFDLSGRVILITGGSGLLGVEHAKAIADAGGTPVIADLRVDAANDCAASIAREYDVPASAVELDVTSCASAQAALGAVLQRHGRLDGLVNNAAHNPKVEGKGLASTRFENFSLDDWSRDLAVGLTGAFLVSQVLGAHMAAHGGGVIVNIASDLGVIAPDQRIYRRPGLAESEQPVKPVTYSVVKGGLVMFTKYLATYWAEQNVRVNALVPGGVYAGQPDDFVERLSSLIPMGRMAKRDEYRAALVFLCSDASSYMTGSNLIVDGGRTCW